MQEYFFSEDNITNQTKKLIINLELTEDQLNKDVVLKCRKIILNHMKDVFTKYGNSKPSNVNVPDFIKKLNVKSLSDCIRMFEEKF